MMGTRLSDLVAVGRSARHTCLHLLLVLLLHLHPYTCTIASTTYFCAMEVTGNLKPCDATEELDCSSHRPANDRRGRPAQYVDPRTTDRLPTEAREQDVRMSVHVQEVYFLEML